MAQTFGTVETPSLVFDPIKEDFVAVERHIEHADFQTIDFERIRQALKVPDDARVVDITSYSKAPWTRAASITVEYAGGQTKSYFVKCASGDTGRSAIQGECASLTEISKHNLDIVPAILAVGDYTGGDIQRTFFFVEEFLNIDVEASMPPLPFVKRLAELHIKSVSPTGKFGFAIPTWQGPNKLPTAWDSSWCNLFTTFIRQYFADETRLNGPSEDGEYEKAFRTLIKKTVPALLLPLQARGRYLKPSLLHGDLHPGNCGFDRATGAPKVFDPAVFYGHHEFEFGIWRAYAGFEGCLDEYLKYNPPSEPREQFEDRHMLYHVLAIIAKARGWPSFARKLRQDVTEDMKSLNERYA